MVKVEFYGVGINPTNEDMIQIFYKCTPENKESLMEIVEYARYIEDVEGNYDHEILPTHVMIFQSEDGGEVTQKHIEWYRDWHEGFLENYWDCCSGCINEGEHCCAGGSNICNYKIRERIQKYRDEDSEFRGMLSTGLFFNAYFYQMEYARKNGSNERKALGNLVQWRE
jgi:hypothetical protein